MASEEMGLVPSQRLDTNGLTSQMVFQHEGGLRFGSRPVPDPGPKTRELSGFIDDRFFQSQGDFRRSLYVDDGNRQGQNLNGIRRGGGEGSEGDEEEDDEDEDEEDEEDDVEDRDGEIFRHLLVLMIVVIRLSFLENVTWFLGFVF